MFLSPARGRGWVRGLQAAFEAPQLTSPPGGGEEHEGMREVRLSYADGALALSMAATDSGSSLIAGAAIRSLSWSRLVALTIGAVIALRCISQASATCVELALCFRAAASSAFSTPKPLSLMYFFTPAPRALSAASASDRYL